MSEVVIFGAGDFARVAAVYLGADSPHTVAGFTVHERHITSAKLLDLPVVPFESLDTTHPPNRYSLLVAIGFSRVNEARREVYEQCKARSYELITYVSSRAYRVAEVAIGDNCFVFEANVIQPFVEVGNDVVVWSGNHIGHDSKIGDHCFIASHAVISGNVVVGESTFIGVNATIRDGVTIAPRCVIGAGAVIMKDTEEGGVYGVRGTDARPQKSWELEGF